jgi:predicted PurR-regulated permease PerM
VASNWIPRRGVLVEVTRPAWPLVIKTAVWRKNMNNKDPNLQRQSRANESASPHLWEINWVRDAFYLALVLIGILLAWWLRAIVQPVLLGLLFAYLINPVIVWCQHRWNWSRSFSVITLFAAGSLVVVALGLAIVPVAVSQAGRLVSKLPDYMDTLARRVGIGDEALLEKLRERGAGFMQDPISSLSYLWDGVVTSVGVLSGVVGTTTSIAIGIGLFPVYLCFFSWRWPTIVAWPDPFIPASCRDRFREVAGKMDKAVGGYFRTRFIIALIMGVLYSVGWGLAGVPYWLLIGMLGGLLGIIPYAAGFAWLAAMLLRFLELENGITGVNDALSVFLWPTLVYAIVQASDDWGLTPWLQGRQLEMNFVTIILAVLIGGAVAGLLGMLLAVPTAACLRIYWSEVVRPKLATYAESH